MGTGVFVFKGLRDMGNERRRCSWVNPNDPIYVKYHDEEWGQPLHDDRALYELFILETFQAGLSWATILHKRENFRRAYEGFIPARVAAFDAAKVEELMQDAGIIRNRRKIEAAITNARATLALRDVDEAHSPDAAHLGALVWSYRPDADPHPTCAVEVPTALPESRALAADLKARGFRFVGPTTMLALMAAIGIVNTDIVGTHRRPV